MKHLKWIIPVLIIIFCFLGFLIAPHDPEAMDIVNKYAPFSAEFPLGTDQFGRCELSRLLYGGYVTLGIVLLGGGIVLVLGTLIGLWLGRANAARSLVFSSLLDAVTAIPPLAYLIIFVGIWGNSIPIVYIDNRTHGARRRGLGVIHGVQDDTGSGRVSLPEAFHLFSAGDSVQSITSWVRLYFYVLAVFLPVPDADDLPLGPPAGAAPSPQSGFRYSGTAWRCGEAAGVSR